MEIGWDWSKINFGFNGWGMFTFIHRKKADTGVLRHIDLAGTYFFATDLNDSASSFLLSQL